jgi:hypothetical protein
MTTEIDMLNYLVKLQELQRNLSCYYSFSIYVYRDEDDIWFNCNIIKDKNDTMDILEDGIDKTWAFYQFRSKSENDAELKKIIDYLNSLQDETKKTI